MKHEQINYSTIMDLGFNEDENSDEVYKAEHGFEYSIITYDLTKKIYLDWEKDTKLCFLYRIGRKRDGNIVGKMEVNLHDIKQLIGFFSDEPVDFDYIAA